MKKMKTSKIALLLAVAVFAGLTSCQKEIKTDSPVVEKSDTKEISFRSYAEFLNLTQNDSSLVLKVATSDLDLINEHISEADFCRIIKLVSIPTVPVEINNANFVSRDQVVTLPSLVVFGTWRGYLGTDWFISNNIGIDVPAMRLDQKALAIDWALRNDPLKKMFTPKYLLPNFKFNSNLGGRLGFGLTKISNTQIRVDMGLSTHGSYSDYFNTDVPDDKGQVSFILNQGGDNKFTGATFTHGTGSYTLNLGGTSIKINTSAFSFTIDPNGKISDVKYNTGIGNYTLWAGGNLRTSSVNAGITNTTNKTITTTFTGGYDNGKFNTGFKGSYGPLSGYINYGPQFDAGLQLNIKF